VTHAPLLFIQTYAPSDFERWVDVIADVATIVIALSIIAVGLAVTYGALKARGMMKRMRTDFEPAIQNVTAVTGTAKAMADKLRGNVEELSATVSETNGKVRRATDAAEARLAEINALVTVAQREAEEAFVRAASTVRGVQVGTEALRRLARRGGEDDAYEGELDDLLDDDGMDDEDVGTEIRVTPPRRRTILD
jgi:methyl-accepting chemotaxis protein